MKITIDTVAKTLALDGGEPLSLYGRPAVEWLSDLWLKLSWVQKYSYTFTWMGRPVIQHPEDMLRLQEVIYFLKPHVVIETGVAHGGSLVFSASLMKAMGHGRAVVGVDVDIRPHNRRALVAYHALVTPGSWIVATDGLMRELWDAPRGDPSWKHDNPAEAAREFAAAQPEFALQAPPWRFNESPLERPITGWPDAWLRRRHDGNAA